MNKSIWALAQLLSCKEEVVLQKRFGGVNPSLGSVHTRTGRRFIQRTRWRRSFFYDSRRRPRLVVFGIDDVGIHVAPCFLTFP